MTGLFPTAYFPPAGYMAEAIRSDSLVIEAFETYLKQTIRNHCLIAGPNGLQQLSIPVSKPGGNHTLTKDVRVSGHDDWQKIHWRSIETAYNSSPFFLYYRDRLAPFFNKQHTFLLDLNLAILEELLNILKANRPVRTTDSYVTEPEGLIDHRSRFGSKHPVNPLHFPSYTQVFSTKTGFLSGLSVLDVVLNLGPESRSFLEQVRIK